MPDPLVISCSAAPGDNLEIYDMTAASTLRRRAKLTVYDSPDRASLYFDEDGARQLFNWLGAWLHGA